MLLLKMLLFCEVCTLLLQMETLQSRHLPAQMDWLAVSCVWRPQSRSVLQTDGGRDRGRPADTSTQARDVQAPSALVLLIGSEHLGHR